MWPEDLCQVGVGFLYLLTGGLLWIGTIVDIVKYRELAFQYNGNVATRIARNILSSSKRRLPSEGQGTLRRDRGMLSQGHYPA